MLHPVALQATVGVLADLVTVNAVRDHRRLIDIVQRHPFLLFRHRNRPADRGGHFRRLAEINITRGKRQAGERQRQ
ncbi:hypothetical protein D3C86_1827640 [compost metagenome]